MRNRKPIRQDLPPEFYVVHDARDDYLNGKISASEAMGTIWIPEVRRLIDKALDMEKEDRKRESR
jgi:hypothetical protein